ncbi:serine hydrolase [Stieleria maiorica]|uniref:serine hydrolase n=1 Tax=Stieleria maiorica TaxID=2795974 RepID=UPI0011CC4DB6
MNPQIAYRTLRYLEPSAPARTRYQYSNSGYLVDGQIVEKYGGTSDTFVQERILDPLEMNRSTSVLPGRSSRSRRWNQLQR